MKIKSIILSSVLMISSASCVQSQSENPEMNSISTKPSAHEATATFAEGCFWHSEIVFQSLVGVRDAVSGYSGGNVPNPDYETVCSGSTGHAEAVQIYYDPTKITYETLVRALFASMDPTTLNQQGNDKGSQYRSIAFYRNDTEMNTIEKVITEITASGKYRDAIVTEVVPFAKFYPAEEYHQEYIAHHPDNGYVQNVSIPDFMEFKKEFKGNFKPTSNTVQ